MREYSPPKPLERISNNLYKDAKGNIISNNITWAPKSDPFILEKITKLFKEVEEKYNFVEIVHEEVSGNIWFMLFCYNHNDKYIDETEKLYQRLEKHFS